MQSEIEVKILNINVDKVKKRLSEIGAIFVGKNIQKRYVYDFNPIQPNKRIRLRQKGEKTTLAIKEIKNDSIDGTREIETTVGSFENTNEILKKLGYEPKAYQENIRISYKLDGVEVEIDFWPQIPPYVEVEGKTIEEVEKIVKILGFEMKQTTSVNTVKVYKSYGIDIMEIKELKFYKKNIKSPLF